MRSVLIPAALLAGLWLPAAGATAALSTLPQVVEAAATQPVAQAADLRRAAAEAGATAQWRGAWLPSLHVDALAARVNSVSTIQTPAGALRLGDEDVGELTVSLRQPILDLASQRYGVRASRLDANAAALLAARTARESAAAAGVQFLNVLMLDAELAAIDAQTKSLHKRVERVQAQADAGRALTADVLDIELAQARVAQQRVRLQARRQTLLQDLRRRTGQAVAALPPTSPPARLPEVAIEQALEQRKDLQALMLQTSAADTKRAQRSASALPTLGASVSYVRSDGSPITPEEDARLGVSLTWTPFTSGRRTAEASAAARERDALQAELREAQAGARVQLVQARGDFQSALALVQLAQSAVASAQSTLQTRSARFDAGRATIDEVLDAEARLAEQTALTASAELQQWQAVISYRLAAGLPLIASD